MWLKVTGMIAPQEGHSWSSGGILIEPLDPERDSNWADGTRRAVWPLRGKLNAAGTAFTTLKGGDLYVPGADIGETALPPKVRVIIDLVDNEGRSWRGVATGRIAASAVGEWNVNAPLTGVVQYGTNEGPNNWLQLTVLDLQAETQKAKDLNAETVRLQADTAQSADRAERAADNLTSITITAGQQAAAAATGRIDAAVATVVSGQALDGAVDTVAQLPAGQPSGTEYTVRATGTVWRYDGTAWADTGLGARPVAERYAATTGLALKKARDGAGPKIVLQGHSLMYGQDTQSSSTKPAVNGAGLTRSTYPPTDVFAEYAALDGRGLQVVNQAFPGDQTKHSLIRWAGQPQGDLKFLWLDTNDGNNYNGDAAGPATIYDSQRRMDQLIREATNGGAQVVVMGGAPINDLVVGAVNGLSAGPISQNVRAYTAAQREVAIRAGAAAFLDVGEVLQEYGEAWTDGIHLLPAPYVEVATSMYALTGPYGSNAPKAAPGTRIGSRARAHWGGAVAQRGGATDNAVIRLQAGQSVFLAVNVTDPCELHVDLFTDPDGFDGTAEIVYGLNRIPGKASKAITMQNRAHGITPVRGHAYASGPRLVQVRCLTGTLEIDGFRFVSRPALLQQPGGAELPRLYRSQLAGQTVGYGNGWAGIGDPTNPITTLTSSGAASAARVRLSTILPGDGKTHGLLLLSGINTGAPYLIRSGYMIFRDGDNTTLKVREWQRDGVVRTVSLGTPFTSGVEWAGTLDVVVDGQTLTVYLDGVQAGQIDGVLYRHYWPGVVTEGIYTVRALSVETL